MPVELAAVQAHTETVGAKKVRVILTLLKEGNLLKELRGSRFRMQRVDAGHEELAALAQLSEEKTAKGLVKL